MAATFCAPRFGTDHPYVPWARLVVALACPHHRHAPQICARAGRRETWIIANPNTAARAGSGSNKELHNFHIHQNRFKCCSSPLLPSSAQHAA
jgi:hypothetical protein